MAGPRMRELTADLFISLDGFASGVDQPAYFGYFGPDLGNWVRDHLDQPQVIIMGRATYAALAGFSASATDEVSVRMSNLPKLVFSSTLKEPLGWKNTRLLKGPVADEIRALKAAAWRSAPIDRQHQPGKEHDASWARRPPPADGLSIDPRQRGQGADL